MNLLIDIGNSSIKYQKGAHDKVKSCPHEDFLNNLDQIISQYNIKELVISESQFDTYHHIISKYDLMISKVSNWYLDVKISNDYLHIDPLNWKKISKDEKELDIDIFLNKKKQIIDQNDFN